MSEASAAAYGRQKSDFIAGVEGGVPVRELPIARGHQRGAILLELRETRSVGGEERFDARVAGNFKRFLSAADYFFQAAEEKNLNADGLRNGRHGTIVTRVAESD